LEFSSGSRHGGISELVRDEEDMSNKRKERDRIVKQRQISK
jgi:hypothetical protein